MKMVLAVLPVFIKLDAKTVNAVIMQLEHEDNTKDTKDVKDTDWSNREIADAYLNNHADQFCNAAKVKISHKNNRQFVPEFFPAILTPPPNMI